MRPDRFVYRTPLPFPAAEVFRWHARPGALERLTPPWEPVEVLQRTGGIAAGDRVVLGLRLGPFRQRWVSEHGHYEADKQFCDVQTAGPFARWEHTHRFEPNGIAASVLEDHIVYALPLGAIGHALGGALVRRKLERLFAYRHRMTAQDLTLHAAYKTATPQHVLVSGASGLIGSALVPFLTTGGHRVTRLVREPSPPAPDAVGWDLERGILAPERLEGVDAVVHLAGENIADGRWTVAKKARIYQSRIVGTQRLCHTLAQLKTPPKVLICASAIGYYGDCGAEVLDEASPAGTDFLAQVCRDWEAATAPACGIRVVHLRLGIVLSPAGGALATLLLPFTLGVGGVLGNGQQYMSWIALDDVVGSIYHAMLTPSVHGAVNAVAPSAVPNRAFSTTLGRVLKRPTWLSFPACVARLACGELADALLLASIRVQPLRLLDTGYTFRYPGLAGALQHLLGKPVAASEAA